MRAAIAGFFMLQREDDLKTGSFPTIDKGFASQFPCLHNFLRQQRSASFEMLWWE
jgi:hypothetical protein